MSPARAKTFADRLKPVVVHEEPDVTHLPQALADAVYPGRVEYPFRIGFRFERFGGDNYPRAVALAQGALVYHEVRLADTVEHQATFEMAQAKSCFDLYRILRQIPSTQVIVNGIKLQAPCSLWPLLVGIVGGEWAWEPLQ
jgi:hypothetical protein